MEASARSDAPPVAVAIVSWNTRDLLDRCLRSLEDDFRAGLVEVWVVDNASSDGSAQLVRDRHPWVRLIASEENLGFGRAVNLVAEQTRTEWITPANADMAVRAGAIAALLATAERDPGAGALAPRLVLTDGSTQHSVFAFPTVPFALGLAVAAYRFSSWAASRMAIPGHWDTERERRVPWAIAAFLMIRREAWDAAGGFDDRQWMYAEDLDLGWRLREAGWATRYVPSAVVDHESAASTSQLFGPQLEPHWQRATYGFIARRRGVGRTWAVALLNTLGALLRFAAALRDPPLARAHARWALVHLRALRGRATLERLR